MGDLSEMKMAEMYHFNTFQNNMFFDFNDLMEEVVSMLHYLV